MFDEFLLAAYPTCNSSWPVEAEGGNASWVGGGVRSNIWFQAQEPKDEISEEVAAEVTPEVEATAEEQVGVGERWLGMEWMRKTRVEALLNRLSSTRSPWGCWRLGENVGDFLWILLEVKDHMKMTCYYMLSYNRNFHIGVEWAL